MRLLWVLSLAAVAWLALPQMAQAQACTPRPAIIVDQHPDGRVVLTATGGNVLSAIAITSDPHYVGSTNVRVDLPGQPPGHVPGFSLDIGPTASYTFQVHTVVSGAATLPVTVTDNCGPWQTMVGGGTANTFPTALPTWTPVPIPTATAIPTFVGPTKTPTALPVFPTGTPVTVPTVNFGPPKVYQGAKQIWSLQGRGNPLVGDYLVLYNAQGQAAGPPIYTSSCTSTPGSTPKASVDCEVTISANLAPATYTLRLMTLSTGAILTLAGNDQVVAVGGSIDGRGQEWGTYSLLDDEQFALGGGFLAAQSFISVPDPSWQATDSWYHIGLNSIGNYTGLFIETGIHKYCTFATDPPCLGHPYMSWVDNNGIIDYTEWNGDASLGPGIYFPTMTIPLNAQTDFLFKIYETAATSFTGEVCFFNGLCCKLWLDGEACREVRTGDRQPTTLQLRYAQVFAGMETLSPGIAGGAGDLGWPSVCCRPNLFTWTGLDCWAHEWRNLDPSRVLGIITTCNPPLSGWGVQTAWR